MSVDLDQLKEQIERHHLTEWRVETEGQLSGPSIKDQYNNEILHIDVGYAVWTCDDELDGCPEVVRDAKAFAQLLCDLPGHALELISEVKRLQRRVHTLELDLAECEAEL